MSNQETKAFQATQMSGNLETVKEKFKNFSNDRKALAARTCLPQGNYGKIPLEIVARKLNVRPSFIYHIDKAKFTMHTLIILLRDGSQRNLTI